MTIEEVLGYQFKKKSLLVQALTPPVLQQRKNGKAFERLEFLGDRILGLVIAEALYVHYCYDEEGKLAKRLSYLASREFCHTIAEKMQLADFIPIKVDELNNSRGIDFCKRRPSEFSNAVFFVMRIAIIRIFAVNLARWQI